jgi:hypothetical protein
MSNRPHPNPRTSPRRRPTRMTTTKLAALVFRAQDLQAEIALGLMSLVLVALGVAVYVPAISRDLAVIALLVTAPLVGFVSARWAWNERGGLRLAALGVAAALTLAAVVSVAATLSSHGALLGSAGLALVVLLGGAAALVQIWAERRRARSWLLVGAGVVAALAAYGPVGFDGASPAQSALRILAVAFVAGGGAGIAVSYVIARAYEPARS